jgi:hypothetical protein
MLFVLTNQVNEDISRKGVDVTSSFNPGDKICDIFTGTVDCLTVDKNGEIPALEIKAGAPPKIYTLSQ